MTSSLVGSEMCIRDSLHAVKSSTLPICRSDRPANLLDLPICPFAETLACLLYTSDAADDM
eukprot:4800259-Prorocentrum_lima.AAC.1